MISSRFRFRGLLPRGILNDQLRLQDPVPTQAIGGLRLSPVESEDIIKLFTKSSSSSIVFLHPSPSR